MTQKQQWWKNAVVYQVYLRSFQDSNGDGIGDLKGVEKRLPYLQRLGVDVIWLSPMYRSPMDDNGYDISDYYQVDPMFGTNADLERLIQEAKKRDIRIILDLVVNHCSDEHVWFQRACENENNKEAGYFYFWKTKNDEVPNNWRSNFGGSVWSRLEDGRWYYHTFSPKQPDLNWENPLLRQEIYRMINWWLQKGIAGFRVDAITFIKKDLSFASVETVDGNLYPVENFENYPGIEMFLEELKRETFDRYDCFTVAEAPGVEEKDFAKYAGKDGFFSMIFDFGWESMEGEEDKSSVDAVERLKKRVFDSQCFISRHGWCGTFLENHDQARCLNRYLDKKNINRYSASALATLYFFLYGTPYIYEGQEIGMENPVWNSLDELQDTRARITCREKLKQGQSENAILEYFSAWGRDNARTPMQWDDSKNAGFTEGNPWMKVGDDYRKVNVDKQWENPDSLLVYYQKLIRLRKEVLKDIMINGIFNPILEAEKGIIAYQRIIDENILSVVVNLVNRRYVLSSESCKKLPCNTLNMALLLNNYDEIIQENERIVLQPYQALVLQYKI